MVNRGTTALPAENEEHFKPLEFPLEIEPRFTPILGELRRFLGIAAKIVASERDRLSVCRTTNFQVGRAQQIPGMLQDERAQWALGEVAKELRYLCVHPSKNTAEKDDLHAHMDIIKNVLDSYQLSLKKSPSAVKAAGVPSKLTQSAAALSVSHGNSTNQSGYTKGKIALLHGTGTPSGKQRTAFNRPPVRPEEYHRCGQAMNRAWKLHNGDTTRCSSQALEALHYMRDLGSNCSHVRWNSDATGPEYATSYRALLRERDTWCGKEECKAPCNHGRCQRDTEFPFEPRCQCDEQWEGSTCNSKTCNPRCLNGVCKQGKCQCALGYVGVGCEFPVCLLSCGQHGKCTAPDKCGCREGWTGKHCKQAICKQKCPAGLKCVAPDTCGSLCHPPCQNGASCVDGKCECPARINVNGTIRENLSGPSCEKSEYWFGESCNVCVEKGGSWCLKDGICVTGKEPPTKDICPASVSGPTFVDQTPLVIKSRADPCRPEYRKCAESAAPVVHFINDPTAFGGACSKEAAARVQDMKEHLGECDGTTIESLKLKMGQLAVNQTYGEILAHAQKKRKHCDHYHIESKADPTQWENRYKQKDEKVTIVIHTKPLDSLGDGKKANLTLKGKDNETVALKTSKKSEEAPKQTEGQKDSGLWYPLKWASNVVNKLTGAQSEHEQTEANTKLSIVVDSDPLDSLGNYTGKAHQVVSVKDIPNKQNGTQPTTEIKEHKVVSVKTVEGVPEEPKVITVTSVDDAQPKDHQIVSVTNLEDTPAHNVVSVKTLEKPKEHQVLSVDPVEKLQNATQAHLVVDKEKHQVMSSSVKSLQDGTKVEKQHEVSGDQIQRAAHKLKRDMGKPNRHPVAAVKRDESAEQVEDTVSGKKLHRAVKKPKKAVVDPVHVPPQKVKPKRHPVSSRPVSSVKTHESTKQEDDEKVEDWGGTKGWDGEEEW